MLFAAVTFAMLAFVVTVGERRPIEPTSGAYAPSVRAFVALAAFGMCLAWPLWRIAMPPAGWSAARVALDALTLVIAFQAAFWPLHLVSGRTLGDAAALDALVCGWAIACGGAVALSAHRRLAPTGAGVVLIAVPCLGVGLDACDAPSPWPALAGPFVGILEGSPAQPPTGAPSFSAIAAWPWAIAAATWAAAVWPRRAAHAGLAGASSIR
jgi:hypothetical protein